MATNKDSFDQLIATVKHGNSQKISVRRNILNKENSDILHNDCVTENDSIIKSNQKTDFLPLNSDYIEDSDSNTSCLLQTYSNENPINFLTVELASSSNDSTDQCAFNHDSSNHQYKTSSDTFNSILKMENLETKKLSSKSTLIHEEITLNNQSRQCNVLENKMDIDTKKSVSKLIKVETENREQINLSKKSESNMKYSSDKCIAYSESKNRWQKKLCNENVDSIVEDIEYFVEDSDNIQKNYGK